MGGIDVFVEVVDAQSFSRAASRLGMPTTTVSSQIARLERRLGVTLIRRTTRKLSVTEAGEKYYEHCKRALAEMAEAEQELASAIAEPSGLLRVVTQPDLSQNLIAPLIKRFLDRYPKTSIELIVTYRSTDMIKEKQDLAILVGPLTDQTLVARKFRTTHLALWASPSYLAKGMPTDAKSLAACDMIAFTLLPRIVTLRSSRKTIEINTEGRLATDDFDTAKSLIVGGQGIGLLPEFIGKELAAEHKLVCVLPQFKSEAYTIWFAYPAQTFVPQTVRAFIEVALSERGHFP